jgi:diguanylate cyclase
MSPAVVPEMLHLPTLLWLSVVVMSSAAAIMSLFSVTHRTYRGYGWWTVAMWLAALGGALQLLRASWPPATAPANLLLLLWPVLIISGLRRFFGRGPLAGSSLVDAGVYVFAALIWLACWLHPELRRWRSFAYGASMLILYFYAAGFVYLLPELHRSSALRTLLGVMVVQALLPLLGLAWALTGGLTVGAQVGTAPSLLSPVMVVPSLVAMLFTVYLCLALTHERTEGDLQESQRRLRVLADIDMLTQVPNRRHFEELASAALTQAAQARAVVMLFDIDHFKAINDSRGHAFGDAALKRVARCARDTLRSRDVLGRLGGDEFISLLPGAGVDEALRAAERIAERLAHDCAEAGEQVLSLSFGVVQIESGESLESAQHRADLALYEAKRQGRQRAVHASGAGDDTVFGESRRLGLNGQP